MGAGQPTRVRADGPAPNDDLHRLACVTSPDFASPSDLPTPFGYSHVVGIPAGRLVWTSGQVAVDASGTFRRDGKRRPGSPSRTSAARWPRRAPAGPMS